MNSRLLVAVGSLTLALGCGGDKNGDNSSSEPPAPTADVVTSADGSARLSIPIGALPAGVALSDVSITPIAPADLPTFTVGTGQVLAGYTLAPDGTQFSSPATLTITLNNIPITGAFFALLTNGAEAHEGKIVELQTGTDGAPLTGMSIELSHFSDLYALRDDGVVVSTSFVAPYSPNVPKGMPFTAEIEVTPSLSGSGEVSGNGVTWSYAWTGPDWEAYLPRWTSTGGVGDQERFESSRSSAASFESFQQEFTCRSEGPYSLTFVAAITLMGTVTDATPPAEPLKLYGMTGSGLNGTCLGPCGNGIIDPGEDCDGLLMPPNTSTCGDHGKTPAGSPVGCVNCTFDFAYCN